ncbi:hypothetical protein IKB17_04755 [bacterium]|nr:hypothetical protein [bacterium]
MKKTLSVLAVLGVFAMVSQTAQAAWYDSNWNPSNWFGRGCNKCEKKCDPCKKVKKCDPCATGAAAPCDPCNMQPKAQPCPCQQPVQKTCDPCENLQNMNR